MDLDPGGMDPSDSGSAGTLREIQALAFKFCAAQLSMRASIAKSARPRRMLNCRSSKTKTLFE